MNDLKPCPFCGSDNVSSYEPESYCLTAFPTNVRVKCRACGALGPNIVAKDMNEVEFATKMAEAAWDMREERDA